MGNKIRVLVPSSGGPGSINMCRSLNMVPDVELIGFDASPHYLLLSETSQRWLAPKRTPPEAWIEWLADLAAKTGAEVFLPNTSPDALLFAQHKERFNLLSFLPSERAFKAGEEKWLSYNIFLEAGLPVPRTWLLNKREDVADAFDILSPAPVWIRGAGIPGKGVGVASLPARTVQQAIAWVEYWKGWGMMTASEYLPGRNLTWLAVYQDGKLVASQGRERDAYVIPHVSPSGITGAPAISHTVNRQDINDLGAKAVLAVDPAFNGPAFVDFKEDEDGQPRITEINVGRLGTTHHFYSAAGANFPELLLRLARGERLPPWVRQHDVLPEDLYWIRTLDGGPVLTDARRINDLLSAGSDQLSALD